MKLFHTSPYLFPWAKQSLMKRFIRGLYYNFVDELYIPPETNGYICRYPKIYKDKWGKPEAVRMTYKGQETYIFVQFGHLSEDTNGIMYEIHTR